MFNSRPCEGAELCVQLNADVMSAVPLCRKPRCAAAHKRVKDNTALGTACQNTGFCQQGRIGGKMPALVRHGVDKPHIALCPDGRDHVVGNAAFFPYNREIRKDVDVS